MKKKGYGFLAGAAALALAGTSWRVSAEAKKEPVKLLLAAASSLQYSLEEELIPLFEEKNPGMIVEGTYDSSGKLQTQIEEGLEADLFFSAAQKQMEALTEQGLIKQDTKTTLLENKIVAIVPKNSKLEIKTFEDLLKGEMLAFGDPKSVPAGTYAEEALSNLGIWEEAKEKASFGSNVTEVLNWVAEGSADAGIVYATDAEMKPDEVCAVCEAPKGSLKNPVLYPAAVLEGTENEKEAELFLEFLKSEEAKEIFESYGFTPWEEEA